MRILLKQLMFVIACALIIIGVFFGIAFVIIGISNRGFHSMMLLAPFSIILGLLSLKLAGINIKRTLGSLAETFPWFI